MKVTVHIGFEQSDLERFDKWRNARRLTRGAGIMTLLEEATGVQNFEKVNSPELEDDGGPPIPQRVTELEAGQGRRR